MRKMKPEPFCKYLLEELLWIWSAQENQSILILIKHEKCLPEKDWDFLLELVNKPG